MRAIKFTDGSVFISADEKIPNNTVLTTFFNPIALYAQSIFPKVVYPNRICKTDMNGNKWEIESRENDGISIFSINGHVANSSDKTVASVVYTDETNCDIYYSTMVGGVPVRIDTNNEIFAAMYIDGNRVDGLSNIQEDLTAYSGYGIQVFINYYTTGNNVGLTYIFYVYPEELNLYEIATLFGHGGGGYQVVIRRIDLSNSFIDYVEPTDPYTPGGTTEPGGGSGDFDGTSIPVDIPELPQISASDTGFITLFNPSISQLQELSNYMWSDLFDIEGWKKIFANPMDAILGLSIVPVLVPSGNARDVIVGNISTGISLTTAASQYVEVDCGTINVKEYWGAYLDYDPYTKAEIYLPYIGTHAIAVDDIMGKPVHVVYHVDILSGACCAYVKCGESVLYSFVGQCSCSIPITGSAWTNVINGALSIAGAIGSMVATGGASAPLAISSIASTAVNQMKPSIEKSGAMGGTGGLLGIQTPYLILTRPRQALPNNQNVFMGYPSFITETLESIKGYTEIENIHLENIPATEEELSEIESLLKNGVIL